MNEKIDVLIEEAERWQAEMKLLRKILLSCQLEEDLKWGKPCYMYNGKNMIVLQGFKEYCALLFVKGALLHEDESELLVKTGANTHVGRQARFTSTKEIKENSDLLKTYIYEAIEVERAGLKVAVKNNEEIETPEELQDIFKKNAALKKAFTALTPGRQRAYTYYFAGAKQSKTRVARIEKHTLHILAGIGLNERR